jgi:hypothetical protein
VVTIDATSAAPPPAEDPPSVNVQLPAAQQTVARGGEVIFQAAVASARSLSGVRAVWSYAGGSLESPMADTTSAAVYQARTAASTTGSPGLDDKGAGRSHPAGTSTCSSRTVFGKPFVPRHIR